jgi:hypothetical protein
VEGGGVKERRGMIQKRDTCNIKGLKESKEEEDWGEE